MMGGALIASTLLVSCKQTRGLQQAATGTYPVAAVGRQDVTLESVYPVTIKGKMDIEIRPRIDGFIDAIYVDEGSVVKAGQTLFKINSPATVQALTTAQAAVVAADAQLATAQLNVARFRPLAEKGIVSQVQLQTYENALASAKAAKEQAQAQLKNAKAQLSWTDVSSPVDGVVGTIPYRKGSLVNNSYVLTTVADINNVFGYFSMNEKDLSKFLETLEGTTQAEKIKNAPPITLTLADGTVYPEKGKLETIAGVLDQSTGSANFRVEFPNPQGQLRSGTSGVIDIPRHLSQVLLIPQQATFAQQDKVNVYKLQGDSVVRKTIDVIPTPDSKSFVVTGGLNQGDKIVTDGLATLSEGMKIKVKQ
jgi:membrane fusion protein (multidrug efflux system)